MASMNKRKPNIYEDKVAAAKGNNPNTGPKKVGTTYPKGWRTKAEREAGPRPKP